MTLDELEKTARAIEDRRTGSLTFEVTVNLARAVLAMLPVVRAAEACRDSPDCFYDEATAFRTVCAAVDAMRTAIGDGK